MESTQFIMVLGFIFASYSVVGNDVIQTLGTFISSNDNRPWYVLYGFAATILVVVLVYGYVTNGGDVSFGRLNRIPYPEHISWWFALAPLVLMLITRLGIPVSTTFLILSIFANEKTIGGMVYKSLFGYVLAFALALGVYLLITKTIESYFIRTREEENDPKWVLAQWGSTAFLWAMWLVQDLANIFVYMPRGEELSPLTFGSGLFILLLLLAYIFYNRGGTIQKIVIAKTNSQDIRSATLINLMYGVILLFFKQYNDLPMSTTWVFIGLLAGRELGINIMGKYRSMRGVINMTLLDLAKTFIGLLVSVVVVYAIRNFAM